MVKRNLALNLEVMECVARAGGTVARRARRASGRAA